MIPRGALDIGWGDLAAGLRFCAERGATVEAGRAVERAWSGADDALACLSVRTGLDLVLRALALPAGSEVIVSAVTIRDVVRILRDHQLIPIPLDLDPAALDVSAAELVRAISPSTRAVLLAHLFGSRMPLDAVASVTRSRGLFLIEDCAQAFDGSDYRGHEQSDVSLFSFGPIKTATALGGALLRFRDGSLLEEARSLQSAYPAQARAEFRRRLGRIALLRLLSQPALFGGLVRFSRVAGVDHDRLLARALRGFPGEDLRKQLRRRPCHPLLRLLLRRIGQDHRGAIARRATFGRRLHAELEGVDRPGSGAEVHSHWVVPVESRDPQGLIRELRAHGYDATTQASSLALVEAPPQREPAVRARRLLERIVFLPAWPGMSEVQVQRLGRLVTGFQNTSRS